MKTNNSQQQDITLLPNTPTKPLQEQPKQRSSQKIWKIIFFLIIIISCFLLHKIYLYQTQQKLDLIRKGHVKQLLIYGIPVCFLVMIIEAILHKLLDQWVQNNFIDHKKWQNKQKRTKRCFMIVKWGYFVLYYVGSVICGYFVIKGTSYWPVWLAGEGQCTEIGRYVNRFQEANQEMMIFYVIQFGRHLAKLIQHTCFTPQGNYYEYSLHHGLSTFLIFYSYLTNMWIIGIFVLLIHDSSDIFLIVSRVLRDGRHQYKILSPICQLLGAILWFGCRIFLLSYCSINSGIRALYQFHYMPQKYDSKIMEIVYLPIAFMTFMLIFLQAIQLFWTYFIILTVVNDKKNGKATKQSYD